MTISDIQVPFIVDDLVPNLKPIDAIIGSLGGHFCLCETIIGKARLNGTPAVLTMRNRRHRRAIR